MGGLSAYTYNKLLNLSGGFKKAIQKFDGEFPVSHLHFSVSYDLSPNVVTIQRITRKYTSSTPTVLKWH